MGIFGKSKKAVQAAAEAKQLEDTIAEKGQALASVKQQMQDCTHHTLDLQQRLAFARTASDKAAQENSNLVSETTRVNGNIETLKQKIAMAQPAVTLKMQERDRLLAEIANEAYSTNALVASADASSRALQDEAQRIRQQQDEAQRAWLDAQDTRDALRQQSESGMKQQALALTELDAAKARLRIIRDEVLALRSQHAEAKERHERDEATHAEQCKMRALVEPQLPELVAKLASLEKHQEELNESRKVHSNSLSLVSRHLEKKKELLHTELDSFQRHCDVVKEAQCLNPISPRSQGLDFKDSGILPASFGSISADMTTQAEKAYRDQRLAAALELLEMEAKLKDMEASAS